MGRDGMGWGGPGWVVRPRSRPGGGAGRCRNLVESWKDLVEGAAAAGPAGTELLRVGGCPPVPLGVRTGRPQAPLVAWGLDGGRTVPLPPPRSSGADPRSAYPGPRSRRSVSGRGCLAIVP